MGFGRQEIDKTLDLGYIRVVGLHHGCKPAVLFDPPNFRPRTMTHIEMCIIAFIRLCTFLYIMSRRAMLSLSLGRGSGLA